MEVASLQRRHQFRRVSLTHCWTPRLGGKQERGRGRLYLTPVYSFFRRRTSSARGYYGFPKEGTYLHRKYKGGTNDRGNGRRREGVQVVVLYILVANIPPDPWVAAVRPHLRAGVASSSHNERTVHFYNKQTNKQTRFRLYFMSLVLHFLLFF